MNRWPLVAIKDFEFKGKSYATGDRFELSIGEAYKVISRRQAKRATASAASTIGPEPAPASMFPTSEPEPAASPGLPTSEPEPAPEAAPEPPAEEEKPRRRRRRQSSYEAEAIPSESSEPEWNSE